MHGRVKQLTPIFFWHLQEIPCAKASDGAKPCASTPDCAGFVFSQKSEKCKLVTYDTLVASQWTYARNDGGLYLTKDVCGQCYICRCSALPPRRLQHFSLVK
jgi:hypothetical protein